MASRRLSTPSLSAALSISAAVLGLACLAPLPAFGFAICGDGICNANAIPGETRLTCPQDCPTEGDADLDGVLDNSDNCPFHDNPGQEDCDGDGQGDRCDGDDAVWVLAEADRDCYIDVDVKLFKWVLELSQEDRYIDTSSCNSPDKWVVRDRVREEHCYIIDHDHPRDCCIDEDFVSPAGKCETSASPIGLRENDTCHR